MTVALDISKNAVMSFRPTRQLVLSRKLRRGYDAGKDDPAYPLSVFERHRAAVERHRPLAGTMLEIDPGGNVAVAALFVAAGLERAACIDITPWNGEPSPLYGALGVNGVLDRIDYRCPATITEAPFPDASFDVIVSHACLEHVDRPAAAVPEIARLLRPGGITTHQVDLRDHRDYSRPLDFLRYPDWLWRLATSSMVLSTNRWRASDFTAAFRASGLEILEAEATELLPVDPRARRLAGRFRRKEADDLRTIGLFLAARKPL